MRGGARRADALGGRCTGSAVALVRASQTLVAMPARSIDTATLAFGLVSIPVKIYSTGEPSHELHFNLVHEGCGERLHQQYVCDKHGKVERDQIIKGQGRRDHRAADRRAGARPGPDGGAQGLARRRARLAGQAGIAHDRSRFARPQRRPRDAPRIDCQALRAREACKGRRAPLDEPERCPAAIQDLLAARAPLT